MTVADSTIEDNNQEFGGGIFNTGTLTVTGSTIAQNSANASGGGIDNQGTASVINSTITDNFAALSNRATNGGSGGGIFNYDTGTLTIVNSTIARNFVEGSSGGGLYIQGGTVTLDNTIVALNHSQQGPNEADLPDDIAGLVSASSAYNLIGTGGSGGLTDGTKHNQVASSTRGFFRWPATAAPPRPSPWSQAALRSMPAA